MCVVAIIFFFSVKKKVLPKMATYTLVCYPHSDSTDDTPKIRYPPQTTKVVTSENLNCSVYEFRQFGPFKGNTYTIAKAKALKIRCLSRKQLTWALLETENLKITLGNDDTTVTRVAEYLDPERPYPWPADGGELKAAIASALQSNTWDDPHGFDIEHWNVSRVTNMQDMFFRASAFNKDLSKWDVGQVTNMERMFYSASLFTGIGLSTWDVGRVTNMRAMFYTAKAFNQDLSTWNVSRVTNMQNMFAAAEAFTGTGLSNWNVGQVTNMGQMFNRATVFNQDLKNWNVSRVTNMNGMFFKASAFNKDISEWDVGQVTDMTGMFFQASAFNEDITGWDTSNGTTFTDMFSGATAWNEAFAPLNSHPGGATTQDGPPSQWYLIT